MTVPQLAALLAACACFASYAWGLARFFRTPNRDARDHRLITWATAASVVAHTVALVFFYRHGWVRFALAMALYAVALGMFWWCIRVNRARPLTLAFSTDRPDHLVTEGPYGVIRHPFYLSYALCWIAGVVATGNWALVGTVVLMAWIYHRAALKEEAKFAASPLAEAYARYAAATGRYLPRLAQGAPGVEPPSGRAPDMIHVRSLCKSYGARVAVDNLSFDVDTGESFGLLGPVGAGKTTALHLLAGLLAPDSGEITIDGEPDPARKATRRHVGIAPQALALYEDLTAEQNARFFGRLYGISGAKLDQHASWALEFVGLGDRRRDPVRTFSGGMARRLNLACALVHNPPVLLLDEPMAGVDPQSRVLFLENIRHLKAHGRTIIYSSHDFGDAESLCDRVAMLHEGKILALDTVEDLIAGYGGPTQVTVEFASPPVDIPGDLPGNVEGTTWKFPSDDPLAALSRLSAQGLQFASVRVDAPGLESVFLSLTGRGPSD